MMKSVFLKKWNICILLVVFIYVNIGIFVTFTFSPTSTFYSGIELVKKLLCEEPTNEIEELLLIRDELDQLTTTGNPKVISLVQRLTKVIKNLGHSNLIESFVNDQLNVDVCPERYIRSKRNEYLTTGWEMENCTNVKPFHDIITVIFYPSEDASDKEMVVEGILKSYPHVTIFMPSFTVTSIELFRNVISVEGNKNWTVGHVWNVLLAAVKTPYVFVGRDLDYFVGWISRLERQVRVISEISAVQIAGGSVRNKTGHWQVGCFQSEMQQFTLRYKEGYYRSIRECMYCDYLVGPFVARTKILQKIRLSEHLPTTMLFEDFFLRVKLKNHLVLNCPDAMHMAWNNAELTTKQNKWTWQPLARTWELNRVILPNGKIFGYTCEESGLMCSLVVKELNSFLIPPCCIEQFRSAITEFHKFAVISNISYELVADSALGIVKLNDHIPWFLHGDINYYVTNHTLIQSSVDHFKKFGLKFINFVYTDKHTTRFFLSYNTPHIYTKFWGKVYLSKDMYEQEIFQKNPTLVKLHDSWVYGSISPGLYVRNRYGREMLKHANNWEQIAKKSWESYEPGIFTKCQNPNHHSCLDHFSTDGNLQFIVPDPN